MLSDTQTLFTTIRSMKIEFIPLILLIQFLVFFVRGLRQQVFFKSLDIKITTRRSFAIFLSGMSMIMTPGGTGSAIKLQFIKNEYGHQRRKTLPIVLYERYHDFLGIVTIMVGFSFFYSILASQIFMGVSTALLVLSFVVLSNKKFTKIILVKFGNFKLIRKFIDDTTETQNSISSLTSKRTFAIGWLISICAVLLDLLTVYLIFYSLSIKIDFFASSQLFLTSILAGVFSFLPGGIGITEGSFLKLLLNYGIGLSFASASVLMIRFLTLWFATLIGAITLKFVKLS